MSKKKYRLKDSVGGYLSLTTPGFACIIRKDDEIELDEQQLIRVGKFVEEVKSKPKKTTKKKSVDIEVVEEDKEDKEEERVIDIFMEDNE